MHRFLFAALMLFAAAAPLAAGTPTDSAKLKFDKQLAVETEDGRFALRLNNWVQVRGTYNDERGQGSRGSNGRDFLNFTVARAKLGMRGHIFAKEFQYYVSLAWTNNANELVENAYFRWAPDPLINIGVGQHKPAFNWFRSLSGARQQFIDRPGVEGLFHQNYAKGLWLSGQFKDDEAIWVRYSAGIYNGVLRADNDFRNNDRAVRSSFFSQQVDLEPMLNLRVETHPLGEVRGDAVDMRGEDQRSAPLFMIGMAVNHFSSRFVNDDLRPDGGLPATGSGRSRAGQSTLAFTADAHLRWHGLSVNVEFWWRHTEFHNFGSLRNLQSFSAQDRPGELSDNGFVLEVGYMIIAKTLDVAVRFGHANFDEFNFNGVSGHALHPDMNEYGLAVGYYLHGHNLKLQADFVYASFQLANRLPTGGPRMPINGQQWPNRSGSDSSDYLITWQMRAQIQWMF